MFRTGRRKSVFLGVAVAAAAFLSALTIAHAQQVTAIRVSAEPGATTSRPIQPEGVQDLYISFDYAGASNSSLQVEVNAPGRLTIFSDSDRYTGSDTAEVRMTGVSVYEAIGVTMDEYSSELLAALTSVRTQAQTQAYMMEATAHIQTIDVARGILETYPPGEINVDVTDLGDAVDELKRLAEEATKLPADDHEGRREIATEMELYAEVVSDVALEVIMGAAEASALPIPPTGSQTESSGYDIILRVNGSPSRSETIWIYGDGTDEVVDPTQQATQRTASTETAISAGGSAGQATQTPQPTTATGATQASQRTSGTEATAEISRQRGATATAVEVQRASTAAAQSGETSGGANDTGDSSDARGEESPPLAGGSNDQQSDPSVRAQPTWTRPARSGGEDGEDTPEEGEAGGRSGSGPNAIVIGLGLAVLAGMALVVRRRFV